MKKVAITNILILIFTLFALFMFQTHLSTTIGLSVDSEGQPAKFDHGFYKVTVTNPNKVVEILNYPVFVILAGVVINSMYYWRSRRIN